MAEKKDRNDNKYEGMSASKAKRERAKDERAAAKRSAAMTKVIAALVVIAIVALIGGIYGRRWYIEKNKTVASEDYSAFLNDDGTIKDLNVSDYVKTFDVNSVKIAAADVAYTDEEMQEDIDSELEEHKVLNTEKTLEVKDGDEVNINYVGTIDGAEFDGGSAENYDLTIGSGSFIDDFEEQLIGKHPGDQVTVNVTFPEEYENNPDLANKDASFAVTINGIKELPELTDAFVKENLSEHAQTVEEYKQYLKDTNYESKISEAISKYITDNTSADKYPGDYIKQLFILTHNVYFHREVTYKQVGYYNCTSFYVIRKNDNISTVKLCTRQSKEVPSENENYNPVQNSYAALWDELRDIQSTIPALNVMRRILEYYFLQLCGYEGSDIRELVLEKEENRKMFIKQVEGQKPDMTDYQLASSLLAYINNPNGISDGLNYVEDCDDVEAYKRVFKMIFDALQQSQHYQMMTGKTIMPKK